MREGREVLIERRGAVLWLELNRPARRNALCPDMLDELGRGLDSAERDTNLRVVCLTGAGEQVFCGGADWTESFGAEEVETGLAAFAALIRRLQHFPKPLVARINGHCFGAAGLALILVCDLAYAREEIQLCTPEAHLGLFPLMTAGILKEQGLARKKLLEMFFSAEPISPQEAERFGLITRCYPRETFDASINRKLAALVGNAPLALQCGRRCLAESEALPTDQSWALLCQRMTELLGSEDAAEGLAAYAQMRQPSWRGR